MLRKELKRLKPYSLDRPLHRIKLNQNESPYDFPAQLKKKALRQIGRLAWNRYPTPFADSLRKEIGRRLAWDPEGIVVAPGSNALISPLLLVASVKGRVMTVAPTFPLYETAARALGNRVIKVPLLPDDFSLPLPAFLQTMRREKPGIVILANPNAPTGTLFREEALLEIIEKSRSLVVVDEAYYPFSGATLKPHLTRHPNLVILRTLSKAFSLGGVRLGYLLADPEVAAAIRKVLPPFAVGTIQEAAGRVAFQNTRYVAEQVREIVRQREFLYHGLQTIPGIKAYPSSANFILIRCCNAGEIYRGLLRQEILVRQLSGQDLADCLRITVGNPRQNLSLLRALGRLKPA